MLALQISCYKGCGWMECGVVDAAGSRVGVCLIRAATADKPRARAHKRHRRPHCSHDGSTTHPPSRPSILQLIAVSRHIHSPGTGSCCCCLPLLLEPEKACLMSCPTARLPTANYSCPGLGGQCEGHLYCVR